MMTMTTVCSGDNCRQGMGAVPGAVLGGLNLGGLDLSSMLSNPALMNMVSNTADTLVNTVIVIIVIIFCVILAKIVGCGFLAVDYVFLSGC